MVHNSVLNLIEKTVCTPSTLINGVTSHSSPLFYFGLINAIIKTGLKWLEKVCSFTSQPAIDVCDINKSSWIILVVLK